MDETIYHYIVALLHDGHLSVPFLTLYIFNTGYGAQAEQLTRTPQNQMYK